MQRIDLSKLFGDRREDVLKFYAVSQGDVDRDISILKEWIGKQQHLPSHLLEDGLLEILLTKNKFSIEKTKMKIENYCSLRPKYLYLFENYEDIVPSQEAAFFTPIIHVTDNLERILICKIFDEKKFDLKRCVVPILLLLEIYIRKDYSCGDIFLVDLAENSTALIGKFDLHHLAILVNLALKVYSSRIKAVHFVNGKKFVNLFVKTIKTVLPTKINNKIFVHEDADSILKTFPKKCLPRDYGGDLKPLKDIVADYDVIFKDNQELFATALQTISNEKMRLSTANDFGTAGTFRKLQID